MHRLFRTDEQLRAAKYPLRCVEHREPQTPGRNDIYSRERLECGHVLPNQTGEAKRRRCFECAMVARGLSSVADLIAALDKEIAEELRRGGSDR
jgi:hypothetical protein